MKNSPQSTSVQSTDFGYGDGAERHVDMGIFLKSLETKSKQSPDGFPRPELGVDNGARRIDDHIRRWREAVKAKAACGIDPFCNGKVIAFSMCGSHLRKAHSQGLLNSRLGIAAPAPTQPQIKAGAVGIGNR